MDENTPIEIAEKGYEDFMAAFDGDGYQTEEPEESTEPVADDADGEEGAQPQEEDEQDDSEAEDTEDGSGEEPTQEAAQTAQETSFTIRVNKEDRTVSREEMFSLAQKGADYDRVKGQVAEREKTITELRESISKNAETLELLEMISAETKLPIADLLDQMHVSLRVKNGETEAEARANIRAIKAERQRDAMKTQAEQKPTQEDVQARAAREVAEFHNRFPGVELTEELCKELTADVRGGMSIADAYQKREIARKDAEIAELKKQMAADKQNKKNRAKAVGSQNDSGGRRTKSAEEEFFAAFEN